MRVKQVSHEVGAVRWHAESAESSSFGTDGIAFVEAASSGQVAERIACVGLVVWESPNVQAGILQTHQPSMSSDRAKKGSGSDLWLLGLPNLQSDCQSVQCHHTTAEAKLQANTLRLTFMVGKLAMQLANFMMSARSTCDALRGSRPAGSRSEIGQMCFHWEIVACH
eukprot:2423685-Amphidinium_carterae.1